MHCEKQRELRVNKLTLAPAPYGLDGISLQEKTQLSREKNIFSSRGKKSPLRKRHPDSMPLLLPSVNLLTRNSICFSFVPENKILAILFGGYSNSPYLCIVIRQKKCADTPIIHQKKCADTPIIRQKKCADTPIIRQKKCADTPIIRQKKCADTPIIRQKKCYRKMEILIYQELVK